MPIPNREFTLRHVFENISEVRNGQRRSSNHFTHFNIPWSIRICHSDQSLSCFICCHQSRKNGAWSIDIEFEIKVISARGNYESQKYKVVHESQTSIGIGLTTMMTWETMIARLVTDNRITIEAHVRILKINGVPRTKIRDFGDPNIRDYDTILIIDNQQFRVRKSILTNQSEVFKEMLDKKDEPPAKKLKSVGPPRMKTLEGVIPHHFQYFLELLNCDDIMNDETVVEILGVAIKFETANVIRMCEDFLFKESDMTLKEKFRLVGKYRLDNLKKKLLSRMTTVSIRPVLSGNVGEMGSYVLSALLQKSLEHEPPLREGYQNRRIIERKLALTYFIKNASKMKIEEQFFGEEAENFNIKWKLGVIRKKDSFDFNLHCGYTPLDQSKWSVHVDYTFRLYSLNGNKMTLNGQSKFGNTDDTDSNLSRLAFMEWKSLHEKYLVDDSASFEVHVKITKMEGIEKRKLMIFDESKKAISDITLLVGGERFYLSKRFLEQQSRYFNRLLYGPFKDATLPEVTVHDVDPKDFQNFLEVYFGKLYIDDSTLAGIWRLGDMYEAEDVNKRCEEFVLEKSELPLKEKLDLAIRYNSKLAKTKLLAGIETAADIQSVLTEKVEDMDASILAVLLVKAIDRYIVID